MSVSVVAPPRFEPTADSSGLEVVDGVRDGLGCAAPRRCSVALSSARWIAHRPIKFPATRQKIPVHQANFAVNVLAGNYAKSRCSTAVSRHETGPQSRQNAEFPVKFPVSREFEWRRASHPL